jgi:putative nucleotidyltransferase with HDIG domain
MRRILFVDDEQGVLDGLRRLLRPRRHEWDMGFVLGGEAGMTQLAAEPYDVIVCDMRMPGVDGATLLKHVQDEYPQMVRIVLSGYTELEGTLQALPVAHQFLSKPCDPDLLKEVIERTCALQELLNGEALRAMIGQMGELPSLPGVYLALAQALADPSTSLGDVARLVEQDMAMSAKCLQLVNSAFFGLGRRVTSVQQAVTYLGTSMIKTLVFTAEIFRAFHADSKLKGFEMEALQNHSIVVGRLASKMLADRQRAEDAFIGGMLHDVGKLILATRLPKEMDELAAAARQRRRPLHELEREVLGVTHAEVGAYLLGLWGLPAAIVEAVAQHHSVGQVAPRTFDVLAAVYVADAIAEDCLAAIGHNGDEVYEPLDLELVTALGVADRLPGWQATGADLTGAAVNGRNHGG